MNTENKELTAERSLEIIAKTIENNRKEMVKSSGRPLIMWGVLVVITSLICFYVMKVTHSGLINLSWFVMTVVGFSLEKYFSRGENHKVSNVISRAINTLWLSFCIFALSTAIIALVIWNIIGMAIPIPITAIILLLMGMACVAMGMILKNGVITTCGLIGGIISPIVALMNAGYNEMLALTTAAIIVLIIPGIILNIQSQKA